MKRLRPGAAAMLVAGILFVPQATANPLRVPGPAGDVEASGYLDGLAVTGTEGGPEQRPQALGVLRLDTSVAGAARAHVEIRGRFGGPFEGGHQGVYNFVHAFQNRSPSLELSEGYLDLHFRSADFAAGVQKFSWGKLDGIPPTDVVNPRDWHDPLVTDFEEAKVGVPALKGVFYPPDLPTLDLSQFRLTLAYIPLAVPPRLPLLAERWFPQNAAPQGAVRLDKDDVENRIERGLRRRCRAPGNSPFCPDADVVVLHDVVIPSELHTANDRPPLRLNAGGVALRLAATWRDMDWDIYHYTGPETGPDAMLDVEVVTRKDPIVNAERHELDFRLRGKATLRQEHTTTHMTGADWSAALGGATIRAEAAHFSGRPYLRVAGDLVAPDALARVPISRTFVDQVLHQTCSRTTPCRGRVRLADLFPETDSVEWGVGADYLFHGFLPLVQMNQIVFLESAPRLVVNDPETRVTLLVRRRFLHDRLELETRGVYALERQSWMVFPRASYLVTDDLRVRLGYLALGGDRDHLIGQFRDNDEVVMQVRYSF